MLTLDSLREKWREVPLGSDMDGRVFSTDLLALPDHELLSRWNAAAARRYGGELGWSGALYAPGFVGRHVLELGSGLGYDGLHFAAAGANWTFTDIVPDNLAVIARVARLRGLQDRVRFHLIEDDFAFAGLSRQYDAIWACGSLIHIPFESARKEALAALRLLKPRGRWIELAYPRGRWLREGQQDFAEWGKLTDGERTPWVEWYDAEKLRQRLAPVPLRTILDFEFCGGNYVWLDCEFASDLPYRAGNRDVGSTYRSIDIGPNTVRLAPGSKRGMLNGSRFTTPRGLFAPTAGIPLNSAGEGLLGVHFTPTEVSILVECRVFCGAVGVGLMDPDGRYYPASESVVDAGIDDQRVSLMMRSDWPATLAFRNLRADLRSEFEIRSVAVRSTL
ncbi:MAG: class I SAM-dependent methyltransferase [Proteobacteria bacterium]|nr:class I SAM-dependent methyltransferase [Pseudomonadota bacterium]